MNPGDRKALVIARRTHKNLKFIYAHKEQDSDVEEFTQLLNSMLGILICLREEYFKGKSVTWEEVEQRGLKPLRIDGDPPSLQCPNLCQSSTTFSKLISSLRHAFAHNCFELIGNPVTGVKVWNVPTKIDNSDANKTWQAELTEEQLIEIANLFIKFLEHEHGSELATNEI